MEDTNKVDVTTEQSQDTTQKVEEQQTEKTFKQEDVNNIVARESKSAQEKLLKELGVEDFENAKDGLAKFKEWQEAQKTEEQKRAEQLDALSKQSEQDKQTISTLTATIEALKLGVNSESVEDVITLASKGVSEEVAIEESIKTILEKYPHFAAKNEEQDKSKVKFINPKNNTIDDVNQDVFKEALKRKYGKI